MKVLIVDDSEAILKIVGKMFEELGYQAVTAKDGAIAQQMLSEDDSWDLVLLDWNMPNVSGIEFLQKNHEEKFYKGPVCMMTTEDDPEKIMKALEFGAVEYIMKPFTPEILSSKVSEVLEMKNAG
jgi:two-component system chemotaxis response regulator CheY